LKEGLGVARGRAGMSHLRDDLTNADEVAVKINDGKLSKSPGLVFQEVHARNAGTRQLTRREGAVEALYILDSDVAAGGGLSRNQFSVGEEVQFDRASSQYGVVAVELARAALEAKSLVELNGRVDGAARKSRNCEIVWLHRCYLFGLRRLTFDLSGAP